MNYREKDFLKENLKELPYFRALIRAVESRFYQTLNFDSPILDLGTGDGHFAKTIFIQNIDCGVDPDFLALEHARKATLYDLLINAHGSEIPYPDEYFKTVFSNSVLEHIEDIDSVLEEVFRITKPNAFFYFCVPNQNFTNNLSIAIFLDKIRMKQMGKIYRQFFNRISRHYHCLAPIEWEKKLSAFGFNIVEYWNYFSPNALSTLEWGHYIGLPYWFSKKIFDRWVLLPKINQSIIYEIIKRIYLENQKQEEGAYTFFICQKAK